MMGFVPKIILDHVIWKTMKEDKARYLKKYKAK